MRTKQADRPPRGFDGYWCKVHGGLGDVLWLAKRFAGQPKPLFLSISNENRTRPRRAGILADHLPNVVGWRFDETAFCPDTGQDWPPAGDPCCAIGKTWAEFSAEQGVRPDAPVRLECNRWLEGGRRIEDWLPDLPVAGDFAFEPCEPPTIRLKKPFVVIHTAGWPDGPEALWLAAVQAFRELAHVYLVGGSYDRRPRHLYQAATRVDQQGVTLVEDTEWCNIVGLLKNCEYCFGHASGFTAVADVLRVRGAILNPYCVPRLTGTWNDLTNKDLVYTGTVELFRGAVVAARDALRGAAAVWPPTGRYAGRPQAASPSCRHAVAAAAELIRPTTAAVLALGDHDPDVAAAVLDGAYGAGGVVRHLQLVGCSADAVADAHREGMRSTVRPQVVLAARPWPRRSSERYELVVVVTDADPVGSADAARSAWSAVCHGGVLVAGGPSAAAAMESLASSLRTRAGTVQNAPGWHYLHRQA